MDPFLFNLAKALASKNEVQGKSILEVGSCNVNGSFKAIFQELGPKKYTGVDIVEGPNVDLVCDVKNIVKQFGKGSFDIVVCTEVIEHVEEWRIAITNMMEVLKIGGIIYLTSRSRGFGIHGYPSDYWRYEIEDIKTIFRKYDILVLHKDQFQDDHFGFFLKAVKINNSLPDLSRHCLYNINTDLPENTLGLENNNIKRTLEQ